MSHLLSASTNVKPVLYVTRGNAVESIHHGIITAVTSDGAVIASLGEIDTPVYARSSAKPIQALPVIEGMMKAGVQLTDAEISLLCASHNGESEHVKTATQLLSTFGLDVSDLKCGIHMPKSPLAAQALRNAHEAPSALHNNCSGKHAGMLALAQLIHADRSDYYLPEHPVQQMMLDAISEITGLTTEEISTAEDGCGVPVFLLPLSRLARAFARMTDPSSVGLAEARRQAAARILNAIAREPFYLAGTNRFDTKLIEATRGRVIGKMGAEGVFALAHRENKCGLAVKILDGNERALYPTVLEALRQLQWITPEEHASLQEFAEPALHNWQGHTVGRLRPCFQLERSS